MALTPNRCCGLLEQKKLNRTNQTRKQDLSLMMNVLMKALGMMMMEVMTILVVMMTVVTVDEDEDDER